jgi:uncharacterized NAD(P)/FAD-binding protein YdhS
MENLPSPPTIAIIGAGFSGTLVATHLLRQARFPLRVHLLERDAGHFGRGVAYSTALGCHLLNVPAGNMSAFPDEPNHFLRWAEGQGAKLLDPPWVTEIGPKTFLPRRAFGEYLGWVLDEAERGAHPGVRLERRMEKVSGLAVGPNGGVELRFAGGDRLSADRAVLAVGNFPPGNPAVADPGFYQSARYHRNPWLPGVLERLLAAESCLLIGSGLTMVDWAMTLAQSGYGGRIHVVSRRGLWPQTHRLGPSAPFVLDPEAGPPKLTAWLRAVRDAIHAADGDWRPVVDALRPATQALWRSLPLPEQRRFMRHLRPFWDVHRHRIAPAVAERLEALAESGQLVRHVGSIQAYREFGEGVEVSMRRRASDATETIRVGAVVNCSGSEANYRRLESALIRNLLEQRLICPDALSLGIMAAPDGAVIDAGGVASDRLYTLGPPQKGLLWETTAVPELRGQAQRLAAVLLDLP